jgi:predicted transcriptional regulator of viral defense system
MNLIKLEQALKKQGMRLFSPLELRRLLGVSPVAATFLVHRYAKQGALIKLRKGLYCLADAPPSDVAMANRLYAPSYVSFEYALAYHRLIPEVAYTVTSATPRPTYAITAAGKRFEYHRLKQPAYTGYEPVTLNGDTVLLATPEKALVDYLYFVSLNKKTLNDRLRVGTLARRRLEAYAKLFDRPSLLQLVHRLR